MARVAARRTAPRNAGCRRPARRDCGSRDARKSRGSRWSPGGSPGLQNRCAGRPPVGRFDSDVLPPKPPDSASNSRVLTSGFQGSIQDTRRRRRPVDEDRRTRHGAAGSWPRGKYVGDRCRRRRRERGAGGRPDQSRDAGHLQRQERGPRGSLSGELLRVTGLLNLNASDPSLLSAIGLVAVASGAPRARRPRVVSSAARRRTRRRRGRGRTTSPGKSPPGGRR